MTSTPGLQRLLPEQPGEVEVLVEEDRRGTVAAFDVYDGDEPFCFISYSHRNTDQVYGVLNDLAERNFRLWYDDSMEIGDDFRNELLDRISRCEAFVLFISEESMASKYCGMEIITAHQLGKRIYPVQLDRDAQVPAPLKLILDNLQHVKAYTNERRYVDKLMASLPPETMRRLRVVDGVVTRCEDNGRSIEVPEGVREIGPGAFKECLQLQSVVLPSTLTRLGDEAFRGCSGLRSIRLGADVGYVGHSAFRDCVRLESVTVESPSTVFAGRAFENCAALTTVSLPDDCEEIFEASFNSCGRLVEAPMPGALRVVGDSAFADCVSLVDVELPPWTVKVDTRAFADCTSLRSVRLPDGLSKIGMSAFKGCSSLVEIQIPGATTHVSSDAFRECTSLTGISVAPENRFYKAVDGVLFNKSKSVLVAYPPAHPGTTYGVPDSVTAVSDWAFCQADRLEHVDLPDSVREIGQGAFFSAEKLVEVVLPSSVTYIDDIAFRGCRTLRRVVIPERVLHIGWGAFLGCPDLVVECVEGSAAWRYCGEHGIERRRA